MFHMRLKKVSNKIIEKVASLRVLLAVPPGIYLGKKAIFTVLSIFIIVILVAFQGIFGSNEILVHADSVKGIGVGIYWDQTCKNETLSFNWERMHAGSANNLTVYIRNEVNSAASLSLGTSNWTPSASSNYISLNWNYSGQVLRVDQVIPLELTLTVSPTIIEITDFSFNTIITITER
jgi:hypothetical protein